ncbi:MAG: sulfatase-like hydrolase/transferase [Candidatus Brocadiia bacterium]
MAADLPHILILMTDQQRADAMGCAGNPVIRTPNMDRLAAEGARLSRACTNSPLCMPARASFISGHHVHRHGIWGNHGELPADYESLFRRLQACGYYTAHVGKSHYYEHGEFHMREREPYMHARGFDYVHETTGPWATLRTQSYMTDAWARKGLLERFRDDYRRRKKDRARAVWPGPLPTEEHMDSYVGRQAVRFLREYDTELPFCLFVGFPGPHEPWDPPEEYADMYDPADVPPPVDPEPAEYPEWAPRHARNHPNKRRAEGLDPETVRRIRAAYYAKVSLIDYWFGEILAVCDEEGFAEDLLVVFWSDHGELAGDHGCLYKSRFWEGALRVPLVFRWPGRIEPGTTSAALAETVDIMPTLLEAVGTTAPDDAAGKSLWPVLEDPTAPLRNGALSEVEKNGSRNAMICTERYKYAADGRERGYMLYNLVEDPDEATNLIGHPEYEEVEKALAARLRLRRGE